MNPLTNMKNVIKLSERELYSTNKTSWHDQYRESAWIFVGGLPYDLTEGDIICIFSQYGEIVNINLIRDKDNGKSKGFCFICFEDQRTTDLSVDNLNGIKLLNRTIRVDHVSSYKVPKDGKNTDAETKKLYNEGCAPKPVPLVVAPSVQVKKDPWDVRETLADQIDFEIKLPSRLPIAPIKVEKFSDDEATGKKEAKVKKQKKSKKKSKKKKKKRDLSSSRSESSGEDSDDEKRKDKERLKHKREPEVIAKHRREPEPNTRHYRDQRQDGRRKSRSVSPDNRKYRRSRSRSHDRGRRDFYKSSHYSRK